MRVLFILKDFPVISESFILNQITGLLTQGHEVDIYATYRGDRTKIHPDVENFNLLDRTIYVPELPQNWFYRFLKGLLLLLQHFPRNPKVVLRSLNIFKYGRSAAALRLFFPIVPLLGQRPYDIIHCQFGMLGLDALMLRELGVIQGAIITSFRGYDISWYVKEHGNRAYDPLFAGGEFFLANCEFFRQRAVRLGCDERKIVVHRSGIACDRFQYRPRRLNSDETVRIVTIGRLIEKKGIEYGIRAIAKVLRTYPHLEYFIVGDGILRESLQQLINALQVGDRIHLLGSKNQPEIIELLDSAHLFIATSVTANDGNQDAPVNTLKEAMAMGLPVIASQHGGIPELVEDGVSGYLVPERDSEAIAEKVIALLSRPETWAMMGQKGRDRVEAEYDMYKLNRELVSLYSQVLTANVPVSDAPILNQVKLPCT